MAELWRCQDALSALSTGRAAVSSWQRAVSGAWLIPVQLRSAADSASPATSSLRAEPIGAMETSSLSESRRVAGSGWSSVFMSCAIPLDLITSAIPASEVWSRSIRQTPLLWKPGSLLPTSATDELASSVSKLEQYSQDFVPNQPIAIVLSDHSTTL